AGHRTWALQEHLRHGFDCGRWDGACGLAELCTNPLLEGQTVLSCTGDGALVWHAVDFLGQRCEVPLTQPASVQIDAA
ncbi:unnamed protein product, partial [Chrysoparadoxa australica]